MVGRLTAAVLLAMALVRPARADVVVVPTVSLNLRDDAAPPIEPKKRYFKFRSGTRLGPVVHITPPPVGSADDPTIAGATLTVYNAATAPQTATFTLDATYWTVIGTATSFKGYHFHDPTTGDGPVTRVFVKPDKIFVRGGKTNWTYVLGPAPQGTVAVRLTLGTGTTWCAAASFKPPSSTNDTPAKFVGLKGSVPTSCPTIP